MAKAAPKTLEHINVGLAAGRLELESAPLTALGADAAAVALGIVDLGQIMALQHTDAKIDAASQSPAVRVITLAEAADIRGTEEHQDVHKAPGVHLMVPFLGFFDVDELDATLVPFRPPFPLEHPDTHAHAGVFMLVPFVSAPIRFPAYTTFQPDGRAELQYLVRIG